MKKVFTAIVCFIGLVTIAQNHKIEFAEGNWKTHLSSAGKANKLIFFDAYTTWCGPCKAMAKNVFTQDAVANYFNTNFINVKYDMEKGEGITLKDKFGVSAFPTYLFINSEGAVVHKIVGSMTAGQFIREAKNALNPEHTIYGLAKSFEASGYSEASAIAYLDALDKAYESDRRSVVSKLYFDRLEKTSLLEEHNWKLALKYLNNPSSNAFSYLYANRSILTSTYDQNEVNRYFQQVFFSSVYRIKNAYAKNSGIKEAKENAQAIRKLLAENNDYSKGVLAKLDLIEYAAADRWDLYTKKVDEICADTWFYDKSYVAIEAANDLLSFEQENRYKKVLKWADIIRKRNPDLFTQIQLAELRKRVLKRQNKKRKAEVMAQKEKALRKEAAEKMIMTPPILKD